MGMTRLVIRTYSVVLFEHELVALVLAPHRQQLPFKFLNVRSSLVVILHHLLLHELLLCKPLSLSLLRLTLFELPPLLFLKLLPSTLLSLPRSK